MFQLSFQKVSVQDIINARKKFFTLFNRWIEVAITDLFYFGPVLNCFGAKLVLTHLAQINNLSRVGVARLTEVTESYEHFEIVLQHFSFVFADVFRRKFHLAGNDIVSVLNERGVEHQSTNSCAFRVFEYYFCVATHRKGHHLFFSQIHDDPPLVCLLLVSLTWLMTVNELHIHSIAVINVKTRFTTTVVNSRNTVESNAYKTFYGGGLNLSLIEPFKVIEVTQLTRLTHALSI